MYPRVEHHSGLTLWAQNFIRGGEKTIYHFYREEFNGDFDKAPEDRLYPLHKYTLPDGSVYIETLQEISSWRGAEVFLALKKVKNGKYTWVPKSFWPRKELDSNISGLPPIKRSAYEKRQKRAKLNIPREVLEKVRRYNFWKDEKGRIIRYSETPF